LHKDIPSMPSLFDKIYAKSPVWMQHIGISAYGLIWNRRRYGGDFKKKLIEFQSRDNFSVDQWRDYQTRELRRLLIHSYQYVSYYKDVFSKRHIDEAHLQSFSLEDLVRLPLLEKNIIRTKPDQFISKNSNPEKLHTYLTSGTTGTPLAILSSDGTDRSVQAAYEARVRKWAGLDYQMSRAMIGGRLVVPHGITTPPFWRYNIFERQIYMSAFHISPVNVSDYVRALNHFKPNYLVGYASAHFFLARMIDELGLAFYKPRAVLTSSENLTEEMRHKIEKVYRCEVFDGYSGVENCCLASECECHRMHISQDVGIIEIVNEFGEPVKPGESGEIVATGFLNFDQPLIRFRTGDIAVLSVETCPCGRDMPILENIIGRLEDTVIGRDGREMVRFHGIFAGLPDVREGQIIQDTISDFRIRLVVGVGFGKEEINIIRKRFEERLGLINLNFEFVEQIERTERGKFRAVISHVERHKKD